MRSGVRPCTRQTHACIRNIACTVLHLLHGHPGCTAHLPKISTTRIFTNSVEFWASDSAQLLPTMPTQSLRADDPCAGHQHAAMASADHACSCACIMPTHSPANQVGESACHARAEDGVAREHGVFVIHPVNRLRGLNLGLQDNGHDDAIDGHRLAENDAAE